MIRRVAPSCVIGLALLAAGCHKTQEENVEAQAASASRDLEQRYNAIEAEASNGADAAAAPFDNEADALLNQMSGNTEVAPAGNVAAPPPAAANGARTHR